MDPILDDLNSDQRDAVTHGEGPLMVLAGAGSGKTRVITRRIARLLRDGVEHWRILGLTFTNKAAAEMAKRVEEMGGQRVLVSTFHSACARFLRRNADRLGWPQDYSIYDTYDRDSCIKMLMEELGLDKQGAKPTQVGRRISHLKNVGMTPEDLVLGHGQVDHVVEKIFRPYQALLQKLGAFDFDDLIGKFVELLRDHGDVRENFRDKFRWVLVDEFQDTNSVQFELLRQLVGEPFNLTAVGDPDQSIYKFRGAEVRNVLEFEDHFPNTTIVRLETNYRSTACILRAAEGVIANNTQRLDKRLRTDNDEGDKLVINEFAGPAQEARDFAKRIDALIDSGVPATEIAVFYRSHFLSRGLEEGLREYAIPYKIIGGVSFFERREIKDLLAYLRVLVNPLDDVSMERVINVPPRGIGKVTLQKIRDVASREDMSVFEVVTNPEVRGGLSAKATKGLNQLAAAFESGQALIGKAHDALRKITEEVGYLDHIGDMGDPEDQARIENIAELHNDAAFFDSEIGGGLNAYLQHVSLMTSEDRAQQDQPQVSLMTVHAAKGLEFDHVLIAGLEEGLFPSSRALEEGDLEEERRLMYVALTRARQSAWLGLCRTRMVNGQMTRQGASGFLKEIPPDCVVDGRDDPFESGGGGGFGYGGRSSGGYGDRASYGGDDSWADQSGGSEEFAEYEPDYSSQENELGVGMRVIHPVYGRGTVLRTAGEGHRAKATVSFDRSGEKTLILEYAGLQVIPGGGETSY